MGEHQISILKLFRKRLVVSVSLIASTIIFLGILLFNISTYNYQSRVLINVLGHQRALSQMMAKNATRIYVLMEALRDNKSPESQSQLIKELEDTQTELDKEKRDFEEVFNSTRNGYVVYEMRTVRFDNSSQVFRYQINNISDCWSDFGKSADIMIKSDKLDDSVTNATISINEKNENLYNSCDNITEFVVDLAKNKAVKNIALSMLLVITSLIMIAYSLFSMYNYLLLPIDSLYKGIYGLGMTGETTDKLPVSSSKTLAPMVTEINDVFHKFNRIISLIENINQNSSFSEILQYIYYAFASFIPYTYIGIALIGDNGKCIKAAYGFSGDPLPGLPQNLIGRETSLCETSLGKVLTTGEPRIINDLEAYTSGKPLKYYNKVILEAGIRSSITLPLRYNNKPVGMIFFSSTHRNVYKDEHLKFLQTLANSIAIAFQKNIFIEELLYSSILALAKLAESRDEDTGEHLNRMKIYSRYITQFLFENSKYKDHVSLDFIEDIEKFSPLHDIGKVGIRDKILLKPGKLTPEEFEEMKYHTNYGAEVLKAADENMMKNGKSVFRLGIEIAGAHHERWDGSGYPRGLKGEEIPLSARIVSVADVFDALTSRRPYKEPFSLETSLEIITRDSGKHFDPEIVKVFIENKDRIVELYNDFKDISKLDKTS